MLPSLTLTSVIAFSGLRAYALLQNKPLAIITFVLGMFPFVINLVGFVYYVHSSCMSWLTTELVMSQTAYIMGVTGRALPGPGSGGVAGVRADA